ncbi:hypothetical protein J6590_071287 [Homalodisca vitripennis]|nr:hypothetical protein J6590_071287 [Homalodisca vitripennis]
MAGRTCTGNSINRCHLSLSNPIGVQERYINNRNCRDIREKRAERVRHPLSKLTGRNRIRATFSFFQDDMIEEAVLTRSYPSLILQKYRKDPFRKKCNFGFPRLLALSDHPSASFPLTFPSYGVGVTGKTESCVNEGEVVNTDNISKSRCFTCTCKRNPINAPVRKQEFAVKTTPSLTNRPFPL